jgi:hypothetical protein
MRFYYYAKFFIVGVLFIAILLSINSNVHECTHAQFLCPLNTGMEYIEGASPITAYHKNAGDEYRTILYEQGTISNTSDYVYEHTFIGMGYSSYWNYTRGLSAMNVNGNSINFVAPLWSFFAEIDFYEREKAIALADDLEELIELVKSHSNKRIVAVTGYNKNAEMEAGNIQKEVYTTRTSENPWIIQGRKQNKGKSLIQNTSNWFHGDPDKLEVRDVAYCWRRFNKDADFSIINVIKYNVMWCTAGKTANSPFIPFDLNDPYVHPALEDGSYYQSAEYTSSEIEDIEDAIMAVDGAIIGDARAIQKCIVEGVDKDFSDVMTCLDAIVGITKDPVNRILPDISLKAYPIPSTISS